MPRSFRPGFSLADDLQVAETIAKISTAENWNRRVSLIRQIPEEFGQLGIRRCMLLSRRPFTSPT